MEIAVLLLHKISFGYENCDTDFVLQEDTGCEILLSRVIQANGASVFLR